MGELPFLAYVGAYVDHIYPVVSNIKKIRQFGTIVGYLGAAASLVPPFPPPISGPLNKAGAMITVMHHLSKQPLLVCRAELTRAILVTGTVVGTVSSLDRVLASTGNRTSPKQTDLMATTRFPRPSMCPKSGALAFVHGDFVSGNRCIGI
jgi:hypothetical protein